MTHTPGPWNYRPNQRDGFVVDAIDDDGNIRDTIGGCWANGEEQDEANARLIAAAPDLLEAAETALNLAESNEYDSLPTYVELRAAIAKAKEGQA